MISKDEYVRLYCNEALYLSSGVLVIDADKFHKRLIDDPLKTIEDLNDYGLSEMMQHNDLEKISSLNAKTGRMFTLTPNMDLDPDTFDWGSEDSIG